MRNTYSELGLKANHDDSFNQLDEYARSLNVTSEKYAKKDIIISHKTNMDNFFALQVRADTRSFLMNRCIELKLQQVRDLQLLSVPIFVLKPTKFTNEDRGRFPDFEAPDYATY